jgi:glycine/D-amino acid oxidase-like deaminating enzyme
LLPALCGKVWPVRGQVLSYEAIPPAFAPGMGAGVTATGEYWQQRPTGEIVIGGCRAVRADGDVNVLNNDITDDVQLALEQVLPMLFPQLAGLRVAQRWGGPMAFTPDYVPIADCIPSLPNAWFAGGFCGHGMPFGMVFGKLLAQAAMRRMKPDALAPFSMDRDTLVVGSRTL